MIEYDVGDWNILATIGHGSYGSVFLAEHSTSLIRAGVKILHKKEVNQYELNQVDLELQAMQELCHPNIIKVIRVLPDTNHIAMVMEYAEQGDLLAYLNKTGTLPEQEASELFYQLVDAIRYAHQQQWIHGDLYTKCF